MQSVFRQVSCVAMFIELKFKMVCFMQWSCICKSTETGVFYCSAAWLLDTCAPVRKKIVKSSLIFHLPWW